MSYINRVLQSGEHIVYASKLHWIVYLWGWLVVGLGLVGVIALPRDVALGLFFYAALLVMGAGLGILAVAWIKRVTTEIAVTNKRLIFKEGFISRRTMEMNMDKIESVDVNQSIIGRIFDYGTIVVRGTGAGLEPLKRIDAPIELRNSVMTTSSSAAAAATAPRPSEA
jgi:uncharacterized membrane protein YdbT with pleckstrin-like domain